jgi:hypothetical protein
MQPLVVIPLFATEPLYGHHGHDFTPERRGCYFGLVSTRLIPVRHR